MISIRSILCGLFLVSEVSFNQIIETVIIIRFKNLTQQITEGGNLLYAQNI
jgi:hypothetical protein